MQDFLLTLVVIFVLFKILGKSSSAQKSYTSFSQNNFHTPEKKPEGKISVDYIPENKSTKSNTTQDDDYVDYEEVK